MQETLETIKEKLSLASIEQFEQLFEQYSKDSRVGVQKLLHKLEQEKIKYQLELQRTEKMKTFENQYKDFEYICGIDEVGRGPFAGPVVACAVILPKDCNILYIDDSKKLSEKKREELFENIIKEAISFGIGFVSPIKIDEINILQGTYEAMRQGIHNLSVVPDILLNDAVTIPDIRIKQVPIIKGDTKSISIAAASILAKVTRDRLMEDYDKQYPEYGFAKNKGYGSKEHIDAILKYGPCPIHRMSFLKNYI